GCDSDEFGGVFGIAVVSARAPANVDPRVAAADPAQFLQPLPEGRHESPAIRVVLGQIEQHADASHALALLRARRVRPRRRADERRDERAARHSITSSARASRVGGTSSPSAPAVFRLMTSSYLSGACTGRSPGLAPLRMRST